MPDVEPEPAIAALDETWSATARVCEDLHPDAWEVPTDCPGWTVRDQLSHIIGTELGLLGNATPELPDPMPSYVRNPIGQSNEAWIDERRGVPGIEVLAEFVEVTTKRLEELASLPAEGWDEIGWSPIGQAPYREFMQIRVFDSWIHGQDIRRALERPGDRGGLAEAVAMGRVASAMPFVVGRQVAPPDGTTVVLEVHGPVPRSIALGIEGKRAVLLDDAPENPTLRIDLPSDHFVRLGCGREEPEEALATGQISFAGDEDLAKRIIGAMNFMI